VRLDRGGFLFALQEMAMKHARDWAVLLAFAWLGLAGCGSTEKPEKTLRTQFDEALALKDPAARANRLCSVARKLGEAKDFSNQQQAVRGAADAADKVEEPLIRAGLQIKVAAELVRVEKLVEAREMLDKARETSHAVEDPVAKIRVITDATRGLRAIPSSSTAIAAYCQEAVEVADKLESPVDKAKQFAVIAHSSVGSEIKTLPDDCLAKSRAAAAEITDAAGQTLAQAEIGAALARMEREDEATAAFKEAVACSGKVESPYTRAETQLAMAKTLHAVKREADMNAAIAAAEKSIAKIDSPSDQAAVKERLREFQKKL